MKKILFTLMGLLLITVSSYAQDTVVAKDSVTVATQVTEQNNAELEAQKKVEKELEKAEKERKKAEKAQKKAEKEAKKMERLAKAIGKKRKSIDKTERKIEKLQRKLSKGKSKGKLSPVDEMEMNQKIDKLKIEVVKEKNKLAKLERKQ